MSLLRVVPLFLLIAGVQAQQRDAGFLGGAGFLRSAAIQGGPAGVTAGFSPGAGAGVVVGQDLYSHISGEIRYLFERRDARLRSGGTTTTFSGQTHGVHYDVVFHAKPRQERLRPYVAVGGGVKIFRGTGAEMAYRLLMDYAYLTRTAELKPMLVARAGVKWRIRGHLMARIDFCDQITGFPRKVIAPAPGKAVGGVLHDFVPTVGLSWTF